MSREFISVVCLVVGTFSLCVYSCQNRGPALAEVVEKYEGGKNTWIPRIFRRSGAEDAAGVPEDDDIGERRGSPRVFGRSPATAGAAQSSEPIGVVAPSSTAIRVKSDHPFVIEVQGAPHLLARVSAARGGDTVRLQPLSGGAPVWSDALKEGPNATLYYDERDGLGLIAEGLRIVAVAVATGEERWSIELSDEVRAIERRDDGLVVRTKDEKDRVIDPASGAVTPATVGAPAGENLRSDDSSSMSIDRHFYDHIMTLDGLQIESFLCGPGQRRADLGHATRLPCSDEHGLLFATRRPGTSVPFLVGYDPVAQAERWRQPLASLEDALGAITWGPSVARIGDDVIAAYGESPSRIMRIGLEDGSLRWETRLTGDSTFGVFVTYAGGLLLVKDSVALRSLDPESGEVRACIGRCPE